MGFTEKEDIKRLPQIEEKITKILDSVSLKDSLKQDESLRNTVFLGIKAITETKVKDLPAVQEKYVTRIANIIAGEDDIPARNGKAIIIQKTAEQIFEKMFETVLSDHRETGHKR